MKNSKGIKIAKELIKSKMINQKSTLTTLNKRKKIDEINILKNKINNEIKDIDSLKLSNNHENIKMKIMGCEGKASYEYWRGIKLLVPPDIGFEQRNQKPTDIWILT